MFNMIQNNGGSILIFDMRSMYNILRGHLKYIGDKYSTVPLPLDFLLEHDLNLANVQDWLPNKLFKDPQMQKYKMASPEILKSFKDIKRRFVFIVASHRYNLN